MLLRTVLAAAALSLLVADLAAAATTPRTPTEHVLVHFRPGAGFAERALVAGYGGRVRHAFATDRLLAVEATPSEIAALARNGAVRSVARDPVRRPLGLADTQLVPSLDNGLYGLVATHAVEAHELGFTGTGVRACVADTGLDYTHPDIAANYAGGIDEVSHDSDPWWGGDPEEVHGTHVAATLLGVDNAVGVVGVAPRATLYYARVLGPEGGYASDVMAGVRWLVEKKHCKIVNLSLGGGSSSKTERSFYAQMHREGALIVAAAGNDGTYGLTYPAAYPSVLSVGAVDVRDNHASFSNTGASLDLSAPGVLVLSSVPPGWGSEASVKAGGEFRALGLEFAGSTGGISGSFVRCGLGKPGEFPTTVRGNIALIERGSITFADKVTNAMAAGAAAAVVYNNGPDDFAGTLGEAGSWIPAVGVSAATGAVLAEQGAGTVVNETSSWSYADGTSVAAPHVSGAAALVWSENPSLSNVAVENALKSTATDLGTPGYDTAYGFGLVNAAAAVASENLAGGGR